MNQHIFSLPEGLWRTAMWKPNHFMGICRRPKSFEILAIGIDGTVETLWAVEHRVGFAVRAKTHDPVCRPQHAPALALWKSITVCDNPAFSRSTLCRLSISGMKTQTIQRTNCARYDLQALIISKSNFENLPFGPRCTLVKRLNARIKG